MRKLMLFTIGFGITCALGAYIGGYYLLLFAGVLSLTVGFGLILAGEKNKKGRIPGVILLGMAAGCLWFSLFAMGYLSRAEEMDGKTLRLDAQIVDYSWEGSYGSVADGKIFYEDREYQIRLYFKDDLTLLPGDEVSGDFRIRTTTEGEEREATYHQGKGIFLLGYQKGDIALTEAQQLPVKYFPAYLRLRIKSLLRSAFPEDTAPFAKALLLGDSTDIDYETNTAFKVSGIRHIIAVSGLHVSMLLAVVYLFTGRRRVLTALIGIPVLALFAAVAGFTPSITRACVMQSLMMLSLLLDREYDPPTALSFACIVMLAVNPLVITSVSFQLSVSCMAGIFLFAGRIRGWLMEKSPLGKIQGKGKRLANTIATSVSVSLSASSLTAPLTAIHFGSISLIAPLANLLVLWAVTIVFCALVAVCLLGIFWSAGASVLAWCVSWLIRYILLTAKCLAAFPVAAVYTKSVFILAWIAVCYAALAVFLAVKKKRPFVLCSVMVISLCLSLLLSWWMPMTGECRVTVLDVGQGQSILLQSGERTFLVDCGGDHGDSSADMAAETLISQGITRLDGIIVTHTDDDHAAGIAPLLTRVKTDNLFLPGTADRFLTDRECQSHFVTEDMQLSYDEVRLTIFRSELDSDNESSLAVLFQTKNCDILITGDRGAMAEKLLMHRYTLPELELLVVGHHGSKYSTCEELLEMTKPKTAVISVGKDNNYGHPSQEVLHRLAAIGCAVYRTDIDGTIIYRG